MSPFSESRLSGAVVKDLYQILDKSRECRFFLAKGPPEFFINSFSYLAEGKAILMARKRKNGLVLANVTFRGVGVNKAGQKAFVTEGSFTVTVTVNAIEQFPVAFCY
jgi:hypothetical protein